MIIAVEKLMSLVRISLFCLLFSLLAPQTVRAQSADSFLLKVTRLKQALTQADTINLFPADGGMEVYDIVGTLNSEIEAGLLDILSDKAILKYNIDTLLSHNFLRMTHSLDKRLWIFSWYSNNGGSFQIHFNLVHYRTAAGLPKAVAPPKGENDDGPNLCGVCGSFSAIHKLKNKSKNLYLCMGSGVGCNTCCYEVAAVLELIGDTVNFNYPAFASENGSDACRSLDARCGSIEKFEFNAKKQAVEVIYNTDDITGGNSDDGKSVRISYELKL